MLTPKKTGVALLSPQWFLKVLGQCLRSFPSLLSRDPVIPFSRIYSWICARCNLLNAHQSLPHNTEMTWLYYVHLLESSQDMLQSPDVMVLAIWLCCLDLPQTPAVAS